MSDVRRSHSRSPTDPRPGSAPESLLSRLRTIPRRLVEATRPLDTATDAALRRRWDELPPHVKTSAQLLGRQSLGCEGTHGVFPQCDFACKPCYHSADANRVRVDGRHTVEQIRAQMAFLRDRRGPAAYAQLIGGEVSLLDADDHAAALEAMWAEGRIPMSFSHGDFDDDYLHRVVLRPDGTPRFKAVSWALHIDTTMRGRRGAEKPASEAELNPFRAEACARFAHLEEAHGVRSYVAQTMTVTPENLDQIAGVVRDAIGMGFRMFSFQPAAYVGNEARWAEGYRAFDDDAVLGGDLRGSGARPPVPGPAVRRPAVQPGLLGRARRRPLRAGAGGRRSP